MPPKTALWVLLLVLLGIVPVWAGLHACSVPDILLHYRAVIFEDLQAALRRAGPGAQGSGPGPGLPHVIPQNQTRAPSPRRGSRVGASCGAQKVWAT